MIFVAIICTFLACLVGYALFIQPKQPDWDSLLYEKPQTFTDAGLEAEWGIPQLPKLADANICRAGNNNVQYTAHVMPTERRHSRERTATVVGWLPPSNKVIAGVKPVNRNELVRMISKTLCLQGCEEPHKEFDTWKCQCGMVTRYANSSESLSTGISKQ